MNTDLVKGSQYSFQYKFQRCETCKEANVWKRGEYLVEQTGQVSCRGIDDKVKKIIEAVVNKSVREVSPIYIFVYLNLAKPKEEEIKDLNQPTFAPDSNLLKKLP